MSAPGSPSGAARSRPSAFAGGQSDAAAARPAEPRPAADQAQLHAFTQPPAGLLMPEPTAMRAGLNLSLGTNPPLPLINAPVQAQEPPEDRPDSPPSGCDPDTFKLFVGNIPKSYNELQLLPLFESIGQVIDLVIVRDRNTQESKGSAFLWYATRAQAELAILEFHLRYILPDPAGDNNRRMVLRKARSKAQSLQSQAQQAQVQAQSTQAGLLSGGSLVMPLSQHASYSNMSAPMRRPSGYGAMAGPGMPLQLDSNFPGGHYSVGQPQGPPWNDLIESSSNTATTSGAGTVTMTVLIDNQQFLTVCSYLHSVQAVSGAELRISPAPMTEQLYHLEIRGTQAQVQAAQGLVGSLGSMPRS